MLAAYVVVLHLSNFTILVVCCQTRNQKKRIKYKIKSDCDSAHRTRTNGTYDLLRTYCVGPLLYVCRQCAAQACGARAQLAQMVPKMRTILSLDSRPIHTSVGCLWKLYHSVVWQELAKGAQASWKDISSCFAW